MSNREADDNIGDESDGEGLVGRLRKFVESDDSDTPAKAGSASSPAAPDVPSAWDPPADLGATGGTTASGQEPAWPPPPADSASPTPPIPKSTAPPPFKATQPPQNIADLPAPPTGPSGASVSGATGLGATVAAGAGLGAAAARKPSAADLPGAADVPAEVPSPPTSRAMPVAPNGPDDHFGPPDPESAGSPVRERDPWPEKPTDADTAATNVDASGGKRDLLIGVGLIALAGLVAGGVILLNWNRDRGDDTVAGGTTTTVSSTDAVAALATTTVPPAAAAPSTTSTTAATPPIPTTTIPAETSAADLSGGGSAAVAFANGSPDISLGAALLLDELAASVNSSDRHVLVRGFAAPSEADDEQAAVILSLSRANAVKAALADRGVDPSRMTLFGYGTEKPPASDTSATSEVLLQFAPML